jgi:2-formylbenzoate dehydrogenase
VRRLADVPDCSSAEQEAPTVLGSMAPDNPAAVEEIFGPVLSALTFADEEEAIAIANARR